ncbi:MAG: hypothetical protein ABFE07_24360 [Armatimonadia bacterium]
MASPNQRSSDTLHTSRVVIAALWPYAIVMLLLAFGWLTPYEGQKIARWGLRLSTIQKTPFVMAAVGIPLNAIVVVTSSMGSPLSSLGTIGLVVLGLAGLMLEAHLLVPIILHMR